MAMWNPIKPLKPRGIRFSLPSGFFLGRVSPGYGDAELIPVQDLARQLIDTGLVPPGPVISGGSAITLGFMLAGPMDLSESFKGAASPYDMTLPSGVLTSTINCDTAPTRDWTGYLVTDLALFLASGYPNGCLASATIMAAATTGTITWVSASAVMVAGTVPYFVAPRIPDPTIANVEALFIGDA